MDAPGSSGPDAGPTPATPDPDLPPPAPLWGGSPIWQTRPEFRWGRSFLSLNVLRPITRFLRRDVAPGLVLLAFTAVALVWANTPWADSYTSLWQTRLSFAVGPWEISETLQHWVNDGLMAIFFFVVGLEIKYELAAGQLKNPRVAAVPLMAALGGMVVPAGIYFAFNAGGPGAHGWGIPMATDIAFAIGVLSLLGSRVPVGAKIFLLTLAIADDIGAIAVIAIFYTDDLSLFWLGATAVSLLLVVGLRLLRVWALAPYLVVGVVTWFTMMQSGVHPTVAGVALGLLTPAVPLLRPSVAHEAVGRMVQETAPGMLDREEVVFLLRESSPAVRRVKGRLEPFSNFVVLPVFALANAGVTLQGDLLGAALTAPVTLGIFFGLVVGKIVGITLTTWLATVTRLGRLPDDTHWPVVLGVGMIAGVGFTVAIFIAGLSFPGEAMLTEEAKIGILAASVVAALASLAYLAAVTRGRDGDTEG